MIRKKSLRIAKGDSFLFSRRLLNCIDKCLSKAKVIWLESQSSYSILLSWPAMFFLLLFNCLLLLTKVITQVSIDEGGNQSSVRKP